jgi:hypothetical protein
MHILLTARLCLFYVYVHKIFLFCHFIISFDDCLSAIYERPSLMGIVLQDVPCGVVNTVRVHYSLYVMCRLLIVEHACVILSCLMSLSLIIIQYIVT